MVINKIDPLSDDRGSAPPYKGGLPLSVGRWCLFWFNLRGPLKLCRRVKIDDPGSLLGDEGARFAGILVPR
jgi:hypothetical protein